jgi:hypothetical protein
MPDDDTNDDLPETITYDEVDRAETSDPLSDGDLPGEILFEKTTRLNEGNVNETLGRLEAEDPAAERGPAGANG